MVNRRNLLNEDGQAVTEYLLLIAVIGSIALFAMKAFAPTSVALASPLQNQFKWAYKYGHPQAQGFDEPGGPYKHPRIDGGDTNFRIFFSAGL